MSATASGVEWHPFEEYTDNNRVLPAERRYVLVALKPAERQPQGTAVGYLRYSAGELSLPFFVVPSIGGTVIAWADCLGDGFTPYLYSGVGEHGRPARVRLPIATYWDAVTNGPKDKP